MKRTLTNIVTFIFLGFLFLGGICVVQNLIQNMQSTFSPVPVQSHILAYEKV